MELKSKNNNTSDNKLTFNNIKNGISIGLEKLGDKRYGEEVEQNLVSNIYRNAKNSSHLIYCDTAEIYGLNRSEILLGEISKKVGREKFHISSKVGLSFKFMKDKLSTFRYFDDYLINKAIEGTCERLNTVPNRIYLHWPHPNDSQITINCLKNLVSFSNQLGIKEIGICNISINQPDITLEILKDLGVDVVQERINLLTRKNKFVLKAKKLNFRIVSHSSFAQGILSSSSKEVIAESSMEDFPKFLNSKEIEYEWVNIINSFFIDLSQRLKMTPEEVIVASQKRILGENSEMIIGVKHKRHVDPIFGNFKNVQISESIHEEILSYLDQYQFEPRLPNH